jgi:cell division protein YceG involved in septum cleavage
LTALQAVAMPTEGDYVYFLSGDDDVTYYARTNEEHEKNIVDHCTVKCAME